MKNNTQLSNIIFLEKKEILNKGENIEEIKRLKKHIK
ncbi:hypothetical protein BMS3Bbin08_01406 [bacterium BMS3Bbin08]|nr:hypothetical protein BMS3Bbin08_01406 [bacterium BMS3Bbin08]